MTCDEYRASFLAGEAGAALRGHLESCGSCRSMSGELEHMRTALRDPEAWSEPPPALREQVVDTVVSTAAAAGYPRRRRTTWLAATAAVIVIAVAATAVALWMRSGNEPDWEVPIAGTELAPLAGGSVAGWNTPEGTRLTLDLHGLAPAPDGFVYEFWLSQGRLHISAGTFVAAGYVELWSGVSRRDYPRLWITLEPLDQDPAPSGHTVLDTG